MILAAALLVLVGLGLFIGGWLTGATLLFWLCVAACVAAGIVLLLARARMGREPSARSAAPARSDPRTQQLPASPQANRTDAALPAQDVEPLPPAPAWERTAGRGWETAVAPLGDPATPTVSEPEVADPGTAEPSTAAHAHRGTPGAQDASGEPPVEEVEVTDLLLVVDLTDEVLVVDEHPRYHLDGCRYLAGRDPIPIPLDEARTDGFTPCGWCAPDRTLAERERERGRRTGRRP